jgi:hypothetical protein
MLLFVICLFRFLPGQHRRLFHITSNAISSLARVQPASFNPIFAHLLTLTSQPHYIQDTVFHSKEFVDTSIPIHCSHCQFIDCHRKGGKGGAIFTQSPLFLHTCLFHNCSAKTGGAISTSEFLGIRLTTFSKLSVDHDATFELISCPKFLCDDSLINGITCITHGISKRFDGYQTEITRLNATNLHARSSYASFELGGCTPIFRECAFVDLVSNGRNAGMGIWQCSNFAIQDALFKNITSLEKSDENGFVFWFDGSLLTGAITRCDFIAIHPSHGARVMLMMAGERVIVSECRFECTSKVVANGHSGLTIEASNEFGVAVVPRLVLDSGFGRDSRSQGVGMVSGICMALAVSAVVLEVLACTVCPRAPKLPAALAIQPRTQF